MTYVPPEIPIPPSPSLPTGSNGGVTEFYNLPDNYFTGSVVDAADFDIFLNLVDNTVAASLAAIGYGSIVGGVVGAKVGLTVAVSAWRGILPESSTRNGYAPAIINAATLTIPASSSFVVWASPVSGNYSPTSGYPSLGAPYDSASSGIAAWEVVVDGSNVDGGLPIFSGTTSSSLITATTDLRTSTGTAGLQAAITALQTLEAADVAAIYSKLGAPYAPGATPAPAPIADRLTALEGGGIESGGSIFWGDLQESATDDSTIAEYIAAQIGPAPAPIVPAAVTDDVVIVNLLRAGANILAISGVTTYTDEWMDTLFISPKETGLTNLDMSATSAPVDLVSGEIG